jgi:hypothetical protein
MPEIITAGRDKRAQRLGAAIPSRRIVKKICATETHIATYLHRGFRVRRQVHGNRIAPRISQFGYLTNQIIAF